MRTALNIRLLEKLDTIAERIAKLKPVIARNRNAVDRFDTGCTQSVTPSIEIVHQISNVSLGFFPVNIVLCAHVYLKTADLKPKTPAPCEALRLWYLSKSQHTAIKCTSLVLGSNRNTYLRMMCCLDLH